MENILSFWQMEHNLNTLVNGGGHQFLANVIQPQYFSKWKTTSILLQMEDELNYLLTVDIFNLFIQEIKKQ